MARQPRFRRSPSPVGEVLRRLRVERDLSQIELAALAGLSTRHLGFVELGRTRASRALIERIADSLGLPGEQRAELLEAAGYAAHPSWRPAWHRAVIDQMPFGVIGVDAELRVVFANRAEAALTGVASAGELVGKSLRENPLWELPLVRRIVRRCLTVGAAGAFEAGGTSRHGAPFHVRVDVGPIRDSAVGIRGAVGIVQPLPPALERAQGVWASPLDPRGIPRELEGCTTWPDPRAPCAR